MTTQADQQNPGLKLTIEEYEKLQPITALEYAGVRMKFSTPSSFTVWRARSIRQKEPWTLEWIDTFEPDEVMIDVGANVGMYTIWAAAVRGARVFAFEPEAQNYALLNRNIILNKLSGRATAFCLGLGDSAGLTVLHMADMRVGGSCHSVGEALDYKHEPLKTLFQQGCYVAKLDELVAEGTIPQPAHIKLDVDGFEPKVIAGARRTIENPALKSVLIETNQNLADHMAMVGELKDLGFQVDPAQVARAERKEGPFKGVAEYVFRR